MQSIEAIVLSHGHPDHFLGLSALMGQISDQIMFHVHPDAFLERRLYNPDVGPILLPRLEHEMIQEGGAIVQKNTTPCTIAGDLMLMTGEIERVTLFEIGFPWAEAKINEKWVVDPFRDDQDLVIHVNGFHLTGPLFESIIQPSIDAIHRINPDYVIPMHCTGWNAVNRFASELTSKFLLSTVGTTYTFS
jgi:7,8-dihydropterin-6-yl-methyl-4-(beta-D-ribofuranosyl)aminobenzene 5'-phosphate synthase